MNVAQWLVNSGAQYPQELALARGNEYLLDYQALAQRSAVIAANFQQLYQLKAGDKVALISSNCAEYIELLFAIWHAGLVVVPINAKLHANELHYALENSQSKLCLVSNKLFTDIAGFPQELPELASIIAIGSEQYQRLYVGKTAAIILRSADDPAWIFYTSGTTGKPKGALLSHANLFTMVENYCTDIDAIEVGDCLLHAAPMSHGSGFYALPFVFKGGVNVIPASGQFQPDELSELLQHYRACSFFAAPTMVNRLIDYAEQQQLTELKDFSGLKTLVYGGGPMYQQDLVKAQQVLGNKLVQMYGQGECPMTICALSKYHHQNTQHSDYKKRLASVGVPMASVQVKIVDENGQEQADGQPGEIWVKSPAVMLGYFNNAQASANTLADGWLKTGDIAIKSADGFITLVDRNKDVIISGGSNIYPREVEEILNQHPAVKESSVLGKKDSKWGEIVIAVVVLDKTQEVSAEQLDEFCLKHMTRFKRPKAYFFVEQLPKNNTGKILKTELRKQFG